MRKKLDFFPCVMYNDARQFDKIFRSLRENKIYTLVLHAKNVLDICTLNYAISENIEVVTFMDAKENSISNVYK